MVFALVVAVSLGAAVSGGTSPPAQAAATGIPIHLTAWAPRPFADVVLSAPELAACFLVSPGGWSTVQPPAALPDASELSKALGAQLSGLLEPGSLPALAVVVAAAESGGLAAVAHGDTVLILQSKAEKVEVREIARTVAPVLLLAQVQPAAPDPRCDEPLLMIGQAVASAGALTLAGLPPELRPVRDWLEVKDASPALEALVREALDPETHWQSRRARLLRMGQVGGPSPPLAAAAALVVEAFGDTPRALSKPFDLLLAWQKGTGKGYPPIPKGLRNALTKPSDAGMPKEKEKSDRDEVAWGALARRLSTGAVPFVEIPIVALTVSTANTFASR